MTDNIEVAVLGGGCFWCTEAFFRNLKGVLSVKPGFTGGNKEKPTYQEVCNGDTGHAEVIKIEFDSSQITFNDLLEVFFYTHDPTTLNRQGNDVGEQYRSVIFYTNDAQAKKSKLFINRLNSEKIFNEPIITEIKPLGVFHEAEDYHKNYYERNPDSQYCQAVISPKLRKFSQKFKNLLKS